MKKKNLILSLFFGILFIIVMVMVLLGMTDSFDQMVYNFVISFRSSFLDTYFITITKLGNTTIVVLVILAFVLIMRNRYSLFLVVSAIDAVILTTLIKLGVQRERPEELRLIAQGGYSFPSGHTMMAICVYGYLFYLAMTKIKNKVLKYGVSILLFLVILSIGVSRVYVGVHFASDVLGGYLLSLCYLFLFIEVTKNISFKRG